MSSAKNSKLGPGHLLIINHEKFDDPILKRRGSEKDVVLLRKHFGKYNVPSKEILNPTLDQVIKEITKMQNYDFSNSSCFICAILSHGSNNNGIWASDLRAYSLDNDIETSIQKNKTLFGKPKIFIVQACKGCTEIDYQYNVVHENNDGIITDSIDCTSHYTDCNSSSNQRDPGKCWRFCSTSEDFVAYRDESSGSLFIQSFCDMLEKYGGEFNIEKIFDLASLDVQEKSKKFGRIQIPCKTIRDPMDYVFGDYCKP